MRERENHKDWQSSCYQDSSWTLPPCQHTIRDLCRKAVKHCVLISVHYDYTYYRLDWNIFSSTMASHWENNTSWYSLKCHLFTIITSHQSGLPQISISKNKTDSFYETNRLLDPVLVKNIQSYVFNQFPNFLPGSRQQGGRTWAVEHFSLLAVMFCRK